MTRIAFIGLGNMGGGMAARLVGAGHEVAAFDLSAEALQRAAVRGCTPAASARGAAQSKAAQTVTASKPQPSKRILACCRYSEVSWGAVLATAINILALSGALP